MTEPTDYELMDLYRSWWKDSYGSVPNSQATIIAAAWAKHVLNQHTSNTCPHIRSSDEGTSYCALAEQGND
jgi:hypothetical protein